MTLAEHIISLLFVTNMVLNGGLKFGLERWTVLYNALNTMKAKSLDQGKWSDGQGLYLVKRDRIHGKWVLRLSLGAGTRREMGLGRWPDVSLAEARGRAADARRQIRDGLDPIEERRKTRTIAKRMTITEAIHSCFTARQAELKGDGVAGRWLSPLNNHIIPQIGQVAIEDLDQHRIKETLEPYLAPES